MAPLGLSPLRKLIHLTMALAALSGWLVAPWLPVGLFGLMLVASLVVEGARRWRPGFNRLLWRLLPTTFRAWEKRRVLGSTWFSLGALVSLLLLGQDAGGMGVLYLALGDPAAEIVGRRVGRPGQRKTLAGSLGCLGACLLAGGLGVWLGGINPWAAGIGAVVATLMERWSPPPDDNVWMPLLSGLAVWALCIVLTVAPN